VRKNPPKRKCGMTISTADFYCTCQDERKILQYFYCIPRRPVAIFFLANGICWCLREPQGKNGPQGQKQSVGKN
jgi:hypothetical protein